jgi:methyl-accepting chemotaxis protein
VCWQKKYREYEAINLQTISSLKDEITSSHAHANQIQHACADEQTAKANEYSSYISKFLEDVANRADGISTELEAVSSRMKALNETVVSVSEISDQTDQTSNTGMQYVSKVAENLQAFSESNADLMSIKAQFEDVQQKTEAIRFVGEEAEMLALNAAIEAARAGEAGRGFAVVADSMKALARNSQATTVDIQKIVSTSEKTISDIINNYQSRNDELNENVKLLLDSFSQIKSAITEVSSHASQIQHETHTSSEAILSSESAVKSFLESQVKVLTDLVSVIQGVEIVNVKPSEVKNKLMDYDEIIDVRRPEEYNDELGHIQGSRLVTLQTDFKQEVKKLDPSKSYLFVCRSGGRSTKAAQMAINCGVKRVFNLDGGMLEWNKL